MGGRTRSLFGFLVVLVVGAQLLAFEPAQAAANPGTSATCSFFGVLLKPFGFCQTKKEDPALTEARNFSVYSVVSRGLVAGDSTSTIPLSTQANTGLSRREAETLAQSVYDRNLKSAQTTSALMVALSMWADRQSDSQARNDFYTTIQNDLRVLRESVSRSIGKTRYEISGGSSGSNTTVVDVSVNGTLTSPSLEGTIALPDLTTNALLFTNSSGDLSTNTGLRIDDSGNLLIGTTTAQEQLTVDGAIYIANETPTTTDNRLYSIAGSLYWNGSILAASSSANWSASGGNVYRPTGFVGIGTSSPFAELSVVGDIALTGGLYDSSASLGTSGMVLQTDGTNITWVATNTLGLAADLSASSIQDLSDVATITENEGDLLYWNGSAWADITTSTLAINTDDLVEGSNLFYTNNRVDARINASSTILTTNTESGLESFLSGVSDVFTNNDTIGDANISDSITVSNYLALSAWYATTTDALSEGLTNLYYSTALFASDLAGTTTDALAEGSTNRYYADSLVASYIIGSSTISRLGQSIDESELNISGSPTNGYVLQASSTATGGFVWVATSTLGIEGTGGGGGTSTFAALTDTPSSFSTGQIFYANSSTSIVALSPGGDGTVLKLSGGVPTWGADIGGAGGSGVWASSSNNLLIYPADTNDVVVIGGSATTSSGYQLEVIGDALVSELQATYATTTNAQITTAYIANGFVTGNFDIADGLSLGADASADSDRILNITENVSNNNNFYSIFNNPKITATLSGNRTAYGSYNLIEADAVTEGANDYTTVAVYGEVQVDGSSSVGTARAGQFIVDYNSTTGTGDNAYTLSSTMEVAGGATINTGYGYFSDLNNGGSINNYYGIFLQDVLEGSMTNSYAFWTNQSDVVLDGDGNGIAGGNDGGTDLFFGEGQDAAIWYDGSNFNINPRVAGGGSLVVTSGSLGVGTTSPIAELSVSGDFAVSGGIHASNGSLGNNGEILQSTGSGVEWVPTSTLGLVVDSDLDNYLSLAAWYATNTDALAEGSTNRYYADSLVASYISGSSTIWNQNTESSLESFLSGVTNVFTNNDTITSSNIADEYLFNNGDIATGAYTFSGTTTFTASSTMATTTIANLILTGALGPASGGTGLSSYSNGDLIYATGAATLAALNAGGEGTVLKISGGLPTWGTDLSGDSAIWATSTNGLFISPADVNDIVVIGANATSATGYILEVSGDVLADEIQVTSATTSNLTIGADTISDLTGDGIRVLSNALAVNCADLEGTGIQCSSDNFAIDFSEFDTDSITEGSTQFFSKWAETFGKLYYTPAGSEFVGIADTDPDYTFEIADTNGSGYFALSSAAANDGDILEVDATGQVGINDNTPSYLLDVNGTFRTTGLARLDAGLRVNSETFTDLTGTALTNSGGVLSVSTSSLATYFASTTDFNTEAKLEAILAGSVSNIFTDNDVIGVSNGGTGISFLSHGSLLIASGTADYNQISTSSLAINTDDLVEGSTNLFSQWTLNGSDIYFTGGSVGIGTTSPSTSFSVAGDFFLEGGMYDNTGTRGASGQILQTTGSGLVWVATNTLGFAESLFTDGGATTYLSSTTDNLAIGTTSANAKLTVHGNINISSSTAGILFGGTKYITASSGNDSITFGEGAGSSLLSSALFNTIFGYQAMQNASTSDYDVAIGYRALQNYGGNRNVAIGYRAGQGMQNDFNVIIGYDAGQAASGASNVMMGYVAGGNNSGDSNVMFGNFAGDDNTGDNNVLIGNAVGDGNDGSYNVMIGDNIGSSHAGNYSNYLGYYANAYGLGGEYNNVIGSNAAYGMLGDYNDIIGGEAGYRYYGSSSVLIGAGALHGGGGYFESFNNVVIGRNAGYSALAGATNNILLGYQAADNLTTGTNNIIIGYDVDLQLPTQSNTLTIGNLIFGTGLTATGTDVSSGNIGIGTSSPWKTLSVAGDFSITGALFDGTNASGTNGMVLTSTGDGTAWAATNTLGFAESLFTDGGATTYLSSVSDNLAIGTTTSDAKLSVHGDINISSSTAGISFDGTRMIAAQIGSSTVMLGFQAGLNNIGSTNNIFGYQAGYNNQGGSNNIFGYQAGYNNTSTLNNIIGAQAGYNSIGDQNNIIGYYAGEDNNGFSNVILGTRAGRGSTGDYNILIGDDAGRQNNGNENTILGSDAGYTNTGNYNAILGYFSGNLNSGDYNNIIGPYAGYSNSGDYNDLIGYNAGYSNTGNYNSMIGYGVGRFVKSTSSVLIGSEAFYGETAFKEFDAINNVALGYRAGYTATSGASNNILIGYQAADNLGAGANNIVIGYDVDLQDPDQSNTLNIGNLIFGTSLDATNTALASGNIGIGTTSPSSKLDVWGDFRVGTSSIPTLFADTSDTWVGVGTSTKSTTGTTTEKLTVAGGGIMANAPTDPKVVSRLTLDNIGSARDLVVVGDYTYVAKGADLTIVDVSYPDNPTIVGLLDFSSALQAVAVVGRFAYTAGFLGLEIVDISDPTNPTFVARADTDGFAYDLEVAGRYAYVADGSNGLEIIDISDPTNPTIVGGVDTDGTAYGVTVAGRYAYVGDASNGLEIIDISDPTNPTIVGGVDTDGTAYGVTVAGRYAYLADGNGLDIIDISSSTNPTIASSTIFNGNAAYDIDIAGDYAYLAVTNGMIIVNVSSSTNPQVTSLAGTTGGTGWGIDVVGQYAYIANTSRDLYIIDIGGSEFSSLFAGSLGATQASIDQDLTVGQDALISSNLSVGNDARIGGLLSIQGYSSSTDTLNQALLSLGGNSDRNSFMSFLGGVSSTTQNSWSVGLNHADGSFRIASSSGLSTNAYFTISETGNIGIGTTSPWKTLSVGGDLSVTGSLFDGNNASGTSGMVLTSTGDGTAWAATNTLGFAESLFTDSGNTTFLTSTTDELSVGTSTIGNAKFTIQSEGTSDILNLFETGGSEVFTVLENGNIGIGSTTPTANLSIQGTTGQSGDLFAIASSTGSQYVTVDRDGNVGIGITNPTSLLDVNGAVNAITLDLDADTESDLVGNYMANLDYYELLTSDDDAPMGGLDIRLTKSLVLAGPSTATSSASALNVVRSFDTLNTGDEVVYTSPMINFSDSYSVVVSSNPIVRSTTNIMQLTTNTDHEGALFYGLTSSNDGYLMKLDDQFNDPSPFIVDIEGNVGIATTSTANAALTIQSSSTLDILNLFETSGTEVLTVTESGRLGIGTTSPNALLTIRTPGTNPVSNSSQITLISTGGNIGVGGDEDIIGGIDFFSNDVSIPTTSAAIRAITTANHTTTVRPTALSFFTRPNASDTDIYERMRINADGDVGIGTTSTSTRLTVQDSSISSGAVLRLVDSDSTCDFTADTGGGPSCGSDITLKKDVTPIENELVRILEIEPSLWRWKTDSENDPFKSGFIAQDVEEQFPELVTESLWVDGTQRKFLNIGGLMPYVVGAVQEQQDTMEELLSTGSSSKGTSSPFFKFFDGKEDTIWEQLVAFAQNIGDGILEIAGIETSIVYTARLETDELCLAGECISDFSELSFGAATALASDDTPTTVSVSDSSTMATVYGTVKMERRSTSTTVTFDEPFLNDDPIVLLTPASNFFGDWFILEASSTGFTIELEAKQEERKYFNWQAYGQVRADTTEEETQTTTSSQNTPNTSTSQDNSSNIVTNENPAPTVIDNEESGSSTVLTETETPTSSATSTEADTEVLIATSTENEVGDTGTTSSPTTETETQTGDPTTSGEGTTNNSEDEAATEESGESAPTETGEGVPSETPEETLPLDTPPTETGTSTTP